MIVELYGLPGSGKTTLARRIAAETDFALICVAGKKELLWLNALFFLMHPIRFLFFAFFVAVHSENLRLFYYLFMNSFLHHNAKYMKARRYPRALIDQGHFQNMLIVFEKPMTVDALKTYAAHLCLSDKLLIVDVSPEEAERRLNERGWAPRAWTGSEYMKRFKGAMGANYQTSKEVIKTLAVDAFVIDADAPAEYVYQTVIELIS